MLQIDNKFKVGQEVYMIQKARVKETCTACKGEGHITIDGNKFSCVTCYGTGRLQGNKIYQVVGKNIIDKIKTYTYRLNNKTDEVKTIVKYGFKGGDDYTEAKLFLVEKDAIKECDRLNNANKSEDM